MKYLNKTVWTRPDSYAGFNPEGDYVLAARTRDSDILTESNFECMEKDLLAESQEYETENDEPFIYSWRAHHWACGWIEYLMLRQAAPDALKDHCDTILSELDAYPVYNEDDFSEREYERAQETWARLSVKERAALCAENDISIFAARRDYIPQEDNGGIYEYCRG